ncbi:uncharacterized protein LOC142231442 [Haematobia irritans]|uniref:uncharacterized protein LOC142231442 n=1 Tax=Haematobia irritans TaxID=7368 RepID=UPI003F500121
MPRTHKQSTLIRQRRNRTRMRDIRNVENVTIQRRSYVNAWMLRRRQDVQFRNAERIADAIAHSQQRANNESRAMEMERDRAAHSLRRQDLQYRTQESQRDRVSRSQRRMDIEYRVEEQERDTNARAQRRMDVEYRAEEQERDTNARSQRRIDVEFRAEEQQRDTEARSQRRMDIEYRVEEQERDGNARAQRRMDVEYRAEEQERNTNARSQRRIDVEFRAEEQQRDTEARSQRRMDIEYRVEEQERDSNARAQRRKDVEYRAEEQERNTNARSQRRIDVEFRAEEQQRDTEARSQRRMDIEYRVEEQERDSNARAQRRMDVEYRAEEQERNTNARSQRRIDVEFRAEEQQRDTEARLKKRMDIEYRAREQLRDKLAHATRREHLEYGQLERQTDRIAHARHRENEAFHITDRLRNTAQRQLRRTLERNMQADANRSMAGRVARHRRDSTNRVRSNIRQSQRIREIRANLSADERRQEISSIIVRRNNQRFENYNRAIKQGPTNICTCCGGLWFSNQIDLLDKQGTYVINNINDIFYLSEKFPSSNNMYIFCKTCSRSIKKGKIPNICLANGLDFPEIPDALKGLTPVEERLVTARLPFMIITALGFERQSAIRGAVVNVPISVQETVTSLPRTFDQAHVIQLHLKRRLEYQHNYMTETIRPAKVIEAARYLINTNLYTEHGITIDNTWFESFNSQVIVPFVADREDQQIIQSIFNNQTSSEEINDVPSVEDELEALNPGGQQTLLENIPNENIPQQRVIMAPGEGQRPIDMILDADSEELSFASIYCGQKRSCTETYSKIVRSELRRYDRRCCRIDKLLYSYKKLEMLTIRNAMSIALRKHTRSRNVTAANALNDEYIDSLIRHDDGFRILKGVRSSPAHWEAEKKKAIAMIRQFGLPTFFITLSAAETKWQELLVILAKTVDNMNISEEEALNLPFGEKARLIRSDAITCSRYFEFRFRQLFSLFKMKNGIFDDHFVNKYYWRVEFQQRGSPHVHGMYWLHEAPKVNINDSSTFPDVITFIDRYISTNGADENLAEFIPYQRHNHNRSCTREFRGEKICRYGMPYPPMPETTILLPLPDDCENVLEYKNNFSKIQSLLNANMSADQLEHLNVFKNFLSHENICLSYNEYILSLRSALKKPKIMLIRRFEDRMVNAYNPTILGLHRANMDIQYILDPYACCSYIINYINKSNRGVSRILRDAVEEIKFGNHSIKQKLQHIGHKFISGTEISAQEAAYCCLGMRLSECSNAEIYINTGRPEERVFILKPRDQLERLDPDSTNIYAPGLLNHYMQRHEDLENKCLADFAAEYHFSKNKPNRRQNTVHDLNDPAENPQYMDQDPLEEDQGQEHTDDLEVMLDIQAPLRQLKYFEQKDKSGYMIERIKPHVIRYRHYSVSTHRSDYFRELVMLYRPWRNEEVELLHNDNEATCIAEKELIEINRRKYDVFEERELENILQRLSEEDEVANQILQGEDEAEIDTEFQVLGVPEIDSHMNLLQTPGGAVSEETSDGRLRTVKLPPLISGSNLLQMVQMLNLKKKSNIYLICFTTSNAVIHSMNLLAVVLELNSIPGTDPSVIKVLLTAPTGKAAFGIGGATLHSMFSLPVNQSSSDLRPLNADTVNSMYSKLMYLRLLIIDEISMVGARMFSFLDARLKQIFKSTEIFGGVSVVVFGDLKQLSPVGDRWIFSAPSSDPYSAIYGTTIWEKFKYFELTEIMRQREDNLFAVALNNMSCGQMTEDDIKMLRQRIVTPSAVPTDAIHLFCSNDEVDQYNTAKLNSIQSEEIISNAEDCIKAIGLTEQNKKKVLEAVKLFKVSECQGLPYRLILKVSAKYMVTVNIDTSDGLVNGATGQLMDITLSTTNRRIPIMDITLSTTNRRIPTTLWIHFSEPTVGYVARLKKTPYFQYKRNEQVNVDRKQFPVDPAEPITIHKSQGATYEKVAVHLKPRMNRSSLYVACSRATRANGLFLIGSFNPPRPFTENDAVHMEIVNLRTHKLLKTYFDHLLEPTNLKIVYQNIQSLHAHIEDVRNDKLIMQAHVLCFVETWTLKEEIYNIPGFTILPQMRIDSSESSNRRCKRGLIVFVRDDISHYVTYMHYKRDIIANKPLEYLTFKLKDINFILLYRHKNYSEILFRNELDNICSNIKFPDNKTVILGDFNICRKQNKPETEIRLNQKGLFSFLEMPTTKGMSTIDWCFSNIDYSFISAITYETIHSYHDAICLSISNF